MEKPKLCHLGLYLSKSATKFSLFKSRHEEVWRKGIRIGFGREQADNKSLLFCSQQILKKEKSCGHCPALKATEYSYLTSCFSWPKTYFPLVLPTKDTLLYNKPLQQLNQHEETASSVFVFPPGHYKPTTHNKQTSQMKTGTSSLLPRDETRGEKHPAQSQQTKMSHSPIV